MAITSKFRTPQAILMAGLGAVALLLSGNPAHAARHWADRDDYDR